MVHHAKNRGYGGALQTGFRSATKELIFYTDGDAQYDPAELALLWPQLTPDADMVNGYKISRSDPLHRIIIGRLYHHIVAVLFGLKVRDVDCDFRLMRRSIFERIDLEKTSGVICLEMMKKIQDAGFRIVEVPVHHYHRAYRQVAVLQLPAYFQDRRRRACACGSRWSIRRQHRRAAGRRSVAPRPLVTAGVNDAYREFYRGRRVMITGGLGFIGSNLARQLVELGADVLLVDSLIPDYGGNLFNIDGIADRVRVNVADVRQQSTMNYLVRDREVIFNLAGQVSHIDSMRDPYTDLEINCRSQLTILEACRYNNPAVKVVFAGTRQVYGRPDSLPVDETHLVRPTDVNGINKAAGEYYHLVYNNVFGVRACSLRLTNVYGPRQLIRAQPPGLHRLVHPAGDRGRADPDLRRRLAAPRFRLRGRCRRRVPAGRRERRLQRRGVQRRRRRADQPPRADGAAGRDRRQRAASSTSSWPPDKKAIDIGDFYADSSKFSATTGWTADGAARRRACARTIAFYRQHFDRYVDAGGRAGGARVTRAARSVRCRSAPARGRRRRPRRDRARRRAAAGSSSVPRSRRSKRSSPRPCGARARGRRRQRHRRASR